MILSAFYEAILTRLTTKIADIKHVDLFFNQYLQETEEGEDATAFLRPAVFFEYNPKQWDTLGNKKQESTATFSLHVVSDVIQDADKRTALLIRNKAYEHLALLDKIVYFLQGYNGTGFGSISRTGDRPYTNAKGQMIIHIIDFRVRLQDKAAMVIPTHIDKEDMSLDTTLNMTDNDE